MSKWEDLDMVNKITDILQNYRYDDPEKNGGHAFATAYQIAFDFADRYPEDVKAIGKPIGGAGTGQQDSLSQYIALELSKGITSKRITHMERAFLHSRRIKHMSFRYGDDTVEASTPGTQYDISMYRLK